MNSTMIDTQLLFHSALSPNQGIPLADLQRSPGAPIPINDLALSLVEALPPDLLDLPPIAMVGSTSTSSPITPRTDTTLGPGRGGTDGTPGLGGTDGTPGQGGIC